MTLASIDERNIRTVLLCFILFIYMDWTSYLNIFKYLNELYKFNPSIIHTDYEKSLEIAIKKSDFFSEKIIHICCEIFRPPPRGVKNFQNFSDRGGSKIFNNIFL